jgi:threonine/homoserine/homoserine lactone efflux protein
VAVGVGALVTAIPELALAMKVAGSLYLLYLAYQVAGAGALERGKAGRPLGLLQGAGFQLINPKAWIFALGAVITFRPVDVPAVAGSILVALTMMLVVVPTAALWAGAGDLLGRLVAARREGRLVSLALAALLVATVAYVWV